MKKIKKVKVPEHVQTFSKVFIIQRILNISYTVGFGTIVVRNFSTIYSILIMFLTGIFFCYKCIQVYDKYKKDWLLIESLKEKQAKKHLDDLNGKENSFIKKVVKFMKLGVFGKIFLFISLISWDPVMVVIYYREGYKKYNGIPSLKIFGIFLLSIAVTSTLVVFGLLGIFSLSHWVWNMCKHLF